MADIDFNAYLAGDLTYQQAVEAINQARAAAEAARNAAMYQGMLTYGEVPEATGATPEFVRYFLNSIPQSIRDAVAAATRSGFSQVAQRAYTYDLAQSLMRGNLGERGLIRSTDYPYLTNQNARARQLGQATDLQNLLSGFNTNQQNYLTQLNTLREEQSNIANSAWQRMIDQINASAAASASAYGSEAITSPSGEMVGESWTPTPEQAAGINAAPNALQGIGSDAAQSGGYGGLYTPDPYPALQYLPSDAASSYAAPSPVVPGFGGGRNRQQVRYRSL